MLRDKMNFKRLGLGILLFFTLDICQAQSFLKDSIYSFTSPEPPEVVTLKPASFHFTPYLGRKINFGLVTGNNWCYTVIKVQSAAMGEYMLSIDNTSIDTVMLYRLNSNGKRQLVYIGGNLIPYSRNRKYVWHTLPLSPEDGTTFYLAAFQDRGKSINVGYKITPREQLEKLYVQFDRIIWFYLGIAFLIFVLTVFGYFFSRAKPSDFIPCRADQ